MSVNRYKDGQLTLIAGSGDSNTFTGTKTEVEQAIAAGKIKENWTVYITDDLEDFVNIPSGSNCDCKVEYLTQEQYDTIPNSEKLTNNIEYRITDSDPSTLEAKNMNYDNSESGINAETVQGAIDEVQNNVSSLNEGFIKKFDYTELVDGSNRYSSGSIRIFKYGKIVIVTISLYFKVGIPMEAHTLIRASDLSAIGCAPADNLNSSSVTREGSMVTIDASPLAQYGLLIQPLNKAIAQNDNIRHQMIWITE